MPQLKPNSSLTHLRRDVDSPHDVDPLDSNPLDLTITFDKVVVGKEYDVKGAAGIWLEGRVGQYIF